MSKCGKITNTDAIVDIHGNSVNFILTGGEEHNSKQAIALL